jgi:hypothetical protein
MTEAWVRAIRMGSVVIGLALGAWLVPALAEAVLVDCGKGQKVGPKIKDKAVITIKGNCVENLVIAASDVSISPHGGVPASFTAADPARQTIRLDGAQRVVIDGLGAGGLTINGVVFGISAERSSSLTVRNCVITGATRGGLVSSYGSSVDIDACQITGNSGFGAIAANTASLVISNSTVSGTSGSGLLATRGSYLRVGQDREGTLTLKPVTISANTVNGIAVVDSSSANIVGGVVEGSGGPNIFVGRGSSGQIGFGSNGLNVGVTVQNGSHDGITVEGGNATIGFSTVSGNARAGILLTNAASGRIGILLNSAAYAPTMVTGNGATGIHVGIGASAFIGGTTIDGNGGAAFGGYGVGVHQATAIMAGNNLVQNNAESGVFVRAGSIYIGDSAFGLATDNTIQNNGNLGPNTGGLFAFQNGVIFVNDADILDNAGAAVQAFEAGVIELRAASTATARNAPGVHGATVNFGSALRVRDSAAIVSPGGDGVQASNMSAVNVRDATAVTQGNGAGGVGVRCTNSGPLAVSAATLTGNLTGVTGTTGSHVGCNVFP